MSKFGRRAIKRVFSKIVRKARRARAMHKMVKRGKRVKALNYAKPKVGGIMLT